MTNEILTPANEFAELFQRMVNGISRELDAPLNVADEQTVTQAAFEALLWHLSILIRHKQPDFLPVLCSAIEERISFMDARERRCHASH
jgi:hypothetical protein